MTNASKALLALLVAGCLALPASAGASAATRTCPVVPRAKLTPYLLSPCAGARVAMGRTITFVVHDANPLAAKSASDRPYLNLLTSRRLQDGHLAPGTDGTGIFAQLTPRRGHRGEYTLVSRPQVFKSWWDNHPGTCYVQVQQIDPTASASGITYGPIVAIHVVAPSR